MSAFTELKTPRRACSAITQSPIRKVDDLDKIYEQISYLGHGGFADVFLARKRSSVGRNVVIKLFCMDAVSKESISTYDGAPRDGNEVVDYSSSSNSRFSPDVYRQTVAYPNVPNTNFSGNDNHQREEQSDFPESFERELEVLRKLQTPSNDEDDRALSLVFCETWFIGPNFAGIVMNFCDGGTLAQDIDTKFRTNPSNRMPYSERRIAWYALQLSEALAFAHEKGVFHHNVKSSNILIDWSSGGKLLLADFGSAIESGEESFTMSEIYASPELQNSHARNNKNISADEIESEGIRLEGSKVDSFGLGCIIFELLCCQALVDLPGEQTLAQFISEKGVEAALDLECLQLPWLPDPNINPSPDTKPAAVDDSQPNNQIIGYSFALQSLVKALLEPDPNSRWTPRELQTPLRNDPSSPLLANIIVASQSPVSGEPVTVDNVQLGIFVQRGQCYVEGVSDDAKYNVPFKQQYTVTNQPCVGRMQSITAMPGFNVFSFEELRLLHYTHRAQKLGQTEGDIGVVVKLDPDGQYTQAIFPSPNSSLASTPCTYRIGANRKFELQIAPPLESFFPTPERPKYTGLLSIKSLPRILDKNNVKKQDLKVGRLITKNCMLVAIDLVLDLAIVAPTNKINPVTRARPHHHRPPIAPSSDLILKSSLPPEYWQTNGEVLVEEDDVRQRGAITEVFFADGGGMNIQSYEIVSMKRVQCKELWAEYAQSRNDIAAENWGVCNEHRLFKGTDDRSPGMLINDPGSFFYSFFNSDGVTFSNITSIAHSHCYNDVGGSNDKQIVLSRVTLGRIKSMQSSSFNLVTHSTRRASGMFCIHNLAQVYPEYIITYRSLHVPTSANSNAIDFPTRFSSHQATNSMYDPPTASNRWNRNGTGGAYFTGSGREYSFSLNTGSRYPTSLSISPNSTASGSVRYHQQAGFSFLSQQQPLTSPQRSHHSRLAVLVGGSDPNRADFGTSSRRTTLSLSPPQPSRDTRPRNFNTSSSALISATPRRMESSQENTTEKQQKSSTKQCVVCLEKDVRRICLPCGHACLCEVCSTEQGLRKLRRKCPECRGVIKQVVIIYARVVDD